MCLTDQYLVVLPGGNCKVLRNNKEVFTLKQNMSKAQASKFTDENGKEFEYVTVADRIKEFRNDGVHNNWKVVQTIIKDDEKEVSVQTQLFEPSNIGVITNEGSTAVYNPIPDIQVQSSELKGSSDINTYSALENASTSSFGRALAFLGIGIDKGIASKQEVDGVKEKMAEEKAQSEEKKEEFKESVREKAKSTASAKKSAQVSEPEVLEDKSGITQSEPNISGFLSPGTFGTVIQPQAPANDPRAKMIIFFEAIKRKKGLEFKDIMKTILSIKKDVKDGVVIPNVESVPIAFRDFPSFYKDVPQPLGKEVFIRLAAEHKLEDYFKVKTVEEIASDKS